MKWHKPDIGAHTLRHFIKRYGVDELTAAVLIRRNIAEKEIPYYLEDDFHYFHSPFLFSDMQDVVSRILQAEEEKEVVLVFGDRDVDGITSTVVMVQMLREYGITVRWQVPEGDEPYGLTMQAVEEHAQADGSLIITVDCGITNVDEIKAARTMGIDTIIVDHHNPQDTLPPAIAIINPKVEDDYPLESLCGCALAAKVKQAVAVGHTEFFQSEVTLLNCRPANNAIVADAVYVENGIEIDRISEVMVAGVFQMKQSRLSEFLIGKPVLCYDAKLQKKMLQEGLGKKHSVDIYLDDIASKIHTLFPSLASLSLLEIRRKSRIVRYSPDTFAEIDTLFFLYQSLIQKKFPEIVSSLDKVMDLTGIATLADMMPLVNENRLFVKRGLQRINTYANVGLNALIKVLRLRNITSRDIHWSLSPVINATGRMGTPSKAVELLLHENMEDAVVLAQEIVEINRARKRVGETAWQLVKHKIPENTIEQKIVVIHEKSIIRGVTGIIANRLSKMVNLPAVILATVDGNIIGSIRSARNFRATDFLRRFDDILQNWGGHNEAAGFSMPMDRIESFHKRLAESVPLIEIEEESEQMHCVDVEVPHDYLTPDLEMLVKRFEPYGQGNTAIRFLARNLVLESVEYMGKTQQHLRLLLSGGKYKWTAIYWNAAGQAEANFAVHDTMEVLFEFSKNWYNGVESIQLIIIDVHTISAKKE